MTNAETTVRVDGSDYEILRTFPILHRGWEMDATGYVVRDGEINRLVLTNHGAAYFASKREINEKKKEYKDALAQTEQAIAELGLRA